MPCLPTCARPTPSQAHCATCHASFGGISGFDSHRRGGACLDPAALGLQQIRGIWRQPMSPERANQLMQRAVQARTGPGGRADSNPAAQGVPGPTGAPR